MDAGLVFQKGDDMAILAATQENWPEAIEAVAGFAFLGFMMWLIMRD